VSRLRSAEAQLREQCRAGESRAGAAEEKIARLEELVHTLQREVASKATSTAWLEEQVCAVQWWGDSSGRRAGLGWLEFSPGRAALHPLCSRRGLVELHAAWSQLAALWPAGATNAGLTYLYCERVLACHWAQL
jgi:hypothetical protein